MLFVPTNDRRENHIFSWRRKKAKKKQQQAIRNTLHFCLFSTHTSPKTGTWFARRYCPFCLFTYLSFSIVLFDFFLLLAALVAFTLTETGNRTHTKNYLFICLKLWTEQKRRYRTHNEHTDFRLQSYRKFVFINRPVYGRQNWAKTMLIWFWPPPFWTN